MTKSSSRLLIAGAVLALATLLPAGTLDDQGKAWLATHNDPALINVGGTWDSDFGVLHLDQAEKSRDVNGSGGGYELTGVVSGKSLYMLFATKHGTVDYCAVLDSVSDTNMTGRYYNRLSRLRFGAGLCQEKSRNMYMRKK